METPKHQQRGASSDAVALKRRGRDESEPSIILTSGCILETPTDNLVVNGCVSVCGFLAQLSAARATLGDRGRVHSSALRSIVGAAVSTKFRAKQSYLRCRILR